MKKLRWATVGAVLALALGLWLHQLRLSSSLRQQVQFFEGQQAALSEQIHLLQIERDAATNRAAAALEELARGQSDSAGSASPELLRLRGEVGLLRRQLSVLKAATNSPIMGFASMLNDPAMKEYFEQTQKSSLRARFGDLFRELKLTPQQIDQAIQVMGNLFLKNAEKMYATPAGSLTSAQIAAATAEREAELNAQLRPILGDAGLARLKEVREETPGHATVDLLNGQLGINHLTDQQTDRLFRLVKAEPFELTRGISGDWDPAFWGPQEDIDAHLMKISESNQRILQQAGAFLSPEQVDALNTILNNGINERLAQAAAFIRKP